MSTTRATASSVFNSVLLGYIILLFNRLDMFGKLASGATRRELSMGRGLDEPRLEAVLRVAVSVGALAEDQGTYRLTGLGADLARNRGFFTWMIGGYAPLLEAMDTLLLLPETGWSQFVRGEDVATGSDECNQELMQSIFDEVIDGLPISRAADLGCGNGGRLVNLLGRRPNMTAVGVDISSQAIDSAMKKSADNGLEGRFQLICEDVFDSLTEARPELADVELVMSFMMLHDLFNIEALQGRLFTSLRAAFPRSKYLVFADTCRDEREHDASTVPVFTMGYELVHAMRDIQTFPLAFYHEQFTKGGLRLVEQRDFGVPNTYLFVLEWLD